MPPAAPHSHPEGARDVPDVPGSTTLEAHGRILPHHFERGAGEGVHRAVRGGVRCHLVKEGGGKSVEDKGAGMKMRVQTRRNEHNSRTP